MKLYYHGTKVAPEIVLRVGLRPPDPLKVVDRVRALHGLGDWFLQHDDVVDALRRKLRHRWVYLTRAPCLARAYATRGSNFEGLIRTFAQVATDRPIEHDTRPGWLYLVKVEGSPASLTEELKLAYVPPSAVVTCGVIVR